MNCVSGLDGLDGMTTCVGYESSSHLFVDEMLLSFLHILQ